VPVKVKVVVVMRNAPGDVRVEADVPGGGCFAKH
jgi:hypothetical protein